jgi:hypothetical protein
MSKFAVLISSVLFVCDNIFPRIAVGPVSIGLNTKPKTSVAIQTAKTNILTNVAKTNSKHLRFNQKGGALGAVQGLFTKNNASSKEIRNFYAKNKELIAKEYAAYAKDKADKGKTPSLIAFHRAIVKSARKDLKNTLEGNHTGKRGNDVRLAKTRIAIVIALAIFGGVSLATFIKNIDDYKGDKALPDKSIIKLKHEIMSCLKDENIKALTIQNEIKATGKSAKLNDNFNDALVRCVTEDDDIIRLLQKTKLEDSCKLGGNMCTDMVIGPLCKGVGISIEPNTCSKGIIDESADNLGNYFDNHYAVYRSLMPTSETKELEEELRDCMGKLKTGSGINLEAASARCLTKNKDVMKKLSKADLINACGMGGNICANPLIGPMCRNKKNNFFGYEVACNRPEDTLIPVFKKVTKPSVKDILSNNKKIISENELANFLKDAKNYSIYTNNTPAEKMYRKVLGCMKDDVAILSNPRLEGAINYCVTYVDRDDIDRKDEISIFRFAQSSCASVQDSCSNPIMKKICMFHCNENIKKEAQIITEISKLTPREVSNISSNVSNNEQNAEINKQTSVTPSTPEMLENNIQQPGEDNSAQALQKQIAPEVNKEDDDDDEDAAAEAAVEKEEIESMESDESSESPQENSQQGDNSNAENVSSNEQNNPIVSPEELQKVKELD